MIEEKNKKIEEVNKEISEIEDEINTPIGIDSEDGYIFNEEDAHHLYFRLQELNELRDKLEKGNKKR